MSAITKVHPTVAFLRKSFSSAEVMRRIEEVMPRGVSAQRVVRTAMAAVNADTYLQSCDPSSILRAVMRLAQVGLEPNTPLAQAYLVPYKGKCEPILGYRGMVELARRSGEIVAIEARAVFSGDIFEYEYGLAPKLIHRPGGDPTAEPDTSKVQHFYAVARMEGGGVQWDVMTRGEVLRIQARAMAGKRNVDRSPWTTDWIEMGKKTVLRRLWKLLPISIHAAAMAEREGATERGEVLVDDPEIEGVIDMAEAAAPEERAEAERAHRQAQGEGPGEEEEYQQWAAAIRETDSAKAHAEVMSKIGLARLGSELQQRLMEVSKAHAATLKGGR